MALHPSTFAKCQGNSLLRSGVRLEVTSGCSGPLGISRLMVFALSCSLVFTCDQFLSNKDTW